jgi:hypothetical protein
MVTSIRRQHTIRIWHLWSHLLDDSTPLQIFHALMINIPTAYAVIFHNSYVTHKLAVCIITFNKFFVIFRLAIALSVLVLGGRGVWLSPCFGGQGGLTSAYTFGILKLCIFPIPYWKVFTCVQVTRDNIGNYISARNWPCVPYNVFLWPCVSSNI